MAAMKRAFMYYTGIERQRSLDSSEPANEPVWVSKPVGGAIPNGFWRGQSFHHISQILEQHFLGAGHSRWRVSTPDGVFVLRCIQSHWYLESAPEVPTPLVSKEEIKALLNPGDSENSRITDSRPNSAGRDYDVELRKLFGVMAAAARAEASSSRSPSELCPP